MNFARKRKRESNVSPKISDAEWKVMKVVWKLGTATARQVVEALKDETDWKPKTIHTLLSRLVQKGAVKSGKSEREYVFTPAVAEQDYRLAASRSFLDKVFDGEIAPFLACFLKRETLTRDEIEELKRILQQKGP
jgi:BlaI family penicillinase repressor